jgi:hypothetical protein
MKVRPQRIELQQFGIPGLEFEGEWIEVLSRAALLASVDEEFTEYQREMSRLQRQLMKCSEEEAEGIRGQLEEASERFVDFVLAQQVASWNLKDAEGNMVPLPKEGRQWREALPTGVQLKLFEFLNGLMWGDEPIVPHGGSEDEATRPKKGKRRKG